MFYSPSTGGFYSFAIHGQSMPADSIKISDATYSNLLAELAAGKVISIDASGTPVATVAPQAQPTWDLIRAERNNLLAASDWTQLSDSSADKSSWAAYRKKLRDITTDFASPNLIVWPTSPQ